MKAMKKLSFSEKKSFSGYHPRSYQSGRGGGAKSAVQDTSPIRGEGTRQASHPTAKEFRHGSALSKEGDQNQFACRPYKGVQRELGPADSGSLGTTDSSGFPTTPCKSTSSNISSPTITAVTSTAGIGINRDTGNVRETSHKGGSTRPKGFCFSIFLVPKKDGVHRPVINLKALNKFIVEEHFKMEGFHMVKDLIKPGDWLAKIDLKNAYFLVPVHPSHQRFLQFQWQDRLYQF